jgi:hypothetical protein
MLMYDELQEVEIDYPKKYSVKSKASSELRQNQEEYTDNVIIF